MQRAGVDIAEVAAPAGGIRQRSHDHARAFLCFVVDGCYEDRPARRAQEWPRTSVLLHAKGTRHADALPAGGRLLGLTFGASWDARLELLPRFDGVLAAPPGTAASWLMARLRQEAREPGPCADLACEGLILEVLSVLGRPRGGGRHAAAVRRAEEILRASPGAAVDVARIAREGGIEAGFLARAFRRAHGMSLTAYARRLRVEEASRLIADGMDLADVAASAGFADQSHLTRIFRRVTGTTPAAFRRCLGR
jgi:AraC family transcriptional regulator